MPYYATLAEDLARAKQILAEGAAATEELQDLHVPAIISLAGGTIYGKDLYAAYQLLQSFVEAIEDAQDVTAKLQWLINWLDHQGHLEEHVFTFPDGDVWEATKR